VVLDEGVPVGNAAVRITPGDLVLATDNEGSFLTEELPVGSYHVNVSKEGYHSVELTAVIEDGMTTSLTFNLIRVIKPEPGKATIRGKVLSSEGGPVAFAIISYAGNMTGSVLSGADGAFEITGLESGTYLLNVTAENYLSNNTVTVVLDPGDDRYLEIYLHPTETEGEEKEDLSIFIVLGVIGVIAMLAAAVILFLARRGTNGEYEE
jgi:hypothetical protein